jgi:hypothetical protein
MTDCCILVRYDNGSVHAIVNDDGNITIRSSGSSSSLMNYDPQPRDPRFCHTTDVHWPVPVRWLKAALYNAH